jgi:hypothetical protein
LLVSNKLCANITGYPSYKKKSLVIVEIHELLRESQQKGSKQICDNNDLSRSLKEINRRTSQLDTHGYISSRVYEAGLEHRGSSLFLRKIRWEKKIYVIDIRWQRTGE